MAGKCKHDNLILAKGILDEIEPDQEPFKSGEEVAMEIIHVGEQVMVRYCLDCKTLTEAWIE